MINKADFTLFYFTLTNEIDYIAWLFPVYVHIFHPYVRSYQWFSGWPSLCMEGITEIEHWAAWCLEASGEEMSVSPGGDVINRHYSSPLAPNAVLHTGAALQIVNLWSR